MSLWEKKKKECHCAQMETMQLEKIKITGRIQIFAIDDLSDFEQIS